MLYMRLNLGQVGIFALCNFKRSRTIVRRVIAGKNMELLEKMEALFNVWHGQIEQMLTEHEQIRREADNIGPDVELQYWKNRMDKFHMYATLAVDAIKPINTRSTPLHLQFTVYTV